MKATYLLRFDDICPTMSWHYWEPIEEALLAYDLRPILAVVPENLDPKLTVEPPAPDFWQRVRGWQERGWAIALHGYQHKYVAENPGIVTPRKKTEFAGLPAAEQEAKLRRGLEIFQREGVTPRLWVAPNNAFDATTVRLLSQMGVRIISDGYFRYPFVSRQKVTWIPQQLFSFRPAPAGVWTVCYHHNWWTPAMLQDFRRDLAQYHRQITSLAEVLPASRQARDRWSEFVYTKVGLSRFLIRARLKLWNLWRQPQGAQPPLAPKPQSPVPSCAPGPR